MKPIRRSLKLALSGTALVSLGLAVWPEDESPVPPVRRPSPPSSSASAATAAWPERLVPASREAWPPLAVAQPTGWGPPPAPKPPPPPPAPPPPPPKPPELSWVVVGSLDDAGEVRVLMAGPRGTLALKKGDQIEGQWRVQEVSATDLVLLHLPTQLTRTLKYRTP